MFKQASMKWTEAQQQGWAEATRRKRRHIAVPQQGGKSE